MAASAAALLAPVRRLIALNVAPLLAALTAMLWLRAAVASCACRLSLRRCRCPAMLCLYTDCRGGYHSDLRAAWSSLERTVQSGAPGIK